MSTISGAVAAGAALREVLRRAFFFIGREALFAARFAFFGAALRAFLFAGAFFMAADLDFFAVFFFAFFALRAI